MTHSAPAHVKLHTDGEMQFCLLSLRMTLTAGIGTTVCTPGALKQATLVAVFSP